MSNKQVLVYGLLEPTNYLRGIFVGHIHFIRLMRFRKFIETFHCCSGIGNKVSLNHQNHFKKGKYGTT